MRCDICGKLSPLVTDLKDRLGVSRLLLAKLLLNNGLVVDFLLWLFRWLDPTEKHVGNLVAKITNR